MASDYRVALILNCEGDDPREAVATFIEAITSRGLREWKFKVTDPAGNSSLFWGYLEPVTEGELLADLQDAGETLDAEAPTEAAAEATEPPDDSEDEAVALRLAEQLNTEGAEDGTAEDEV